MLKLIAIIWHLLQLSFQIAKTFFKPLSGSDNHMKQEWLKYIKLIESCRQLS